MYPIERVPYRGVLMRSKLEVRWAEWLDQRGIQWEYEPVKFGYKLRRYTPDFSLHGRVMFLEIKPIKRVNFNDTFLCPYPLVVVHGPPERYETLFQAPYFAYGMQLYKDHWNGFDAAYAAGLQYAPCRVWDFK